MFVLYFNYILPIGQGYDSDASTDKMFKDDQTFKRQIDCLGIN